ncbi:MAG: ABC transporter permease [Acidobacteria bacterium]|nr:ABC transporter permease [Acidobacteriota bacterium]
MRAVRRMWSRLRGVFTGGRRDSDMTAELESHIAMMTDDNIRQGMPPEEARRAAMLTFGSLESAKESVRDQRGLPWMETLAQDVRFALRMLRKNPGFAAAAMLTLALGIGANSAIFTVINAVLLRPLPYPGADRLVMVWESKHVDPNMFPDPEMVKTFKHWQPDNRELDRWSRDNRSFDALAAFRAWTFSFTGSGEPERLDGALVTPGIFAVLGAQPALGRGFTPQENVVGNDRVAVISHRLWLRRFGGTPSALGTAVTLDGYPHQIIGVLPEGFYLHLPGLEVAPDVLAPTAHDMSPRRKWTIHPVGGRLKPGVSAEQAKADLQIAMKGLAAEQPRLYGGSTVNVIPMVEDMSETVRQALLVLAGASGCVLLIVCANMANLLLVRAIARRREAGIRAVLGASRGRLIQQTLAEGVVVAVMGGVLGLVLAQVGLRALTAITPEALLPRSNEIALDPRVFAFVLAASALTGLLIAAIPAWQGSRAYNRESLHERLKEASRSIAGGSARVRRVLLVAEIALAMVLLTGAGLLIRSFARLIAVDPGFRADRALTLGMKLGDAQAGADPKYAGFVDRTLDMVRRIPGVRSAAATNSLPMSWGFTETWGLEIEGRPADGPPVSAYLRSVTPGYFETLSIPLRKGRPFTADDSGRQVAIVNEAMVRRYWPSAAAGSAEPLTRRVKVGEHWREIVGVMANIKHDGQGAEVSPEIYVPYGSNPSPYASLIVRVDGDPMSYASAIRTAIWTVDRNQAIENIQPFDRVLSKSVATPRFRLVLLGLFAGLALAVAVVGIYGVVAYAVSERTPEFGVRMALGANRASILRIVLGEALLLASIGIVLGLAIARATTKVLSAFLFSTSATDARTFTVVAAIMLAVALAASYIPARRATRVDPLAALRCE